MTLDQLGPGLAFEDGFQLLIAGLAVGIIVALVGELTRMRG